MLSINIINFSKKISQLKYSIINIKEKMIYIIIIIIYTLYHYAVHPPSIVYVDPFIYDAEFVHKNNIKSPN
jgi:hypothetical protein